MKRFSEFLQLYFIKGNLTLDRSVLLFLPYLSRYAADRALRQIIFIDKKLKIPRGKTRTGSSPVSGTIERMSILRHSFLVF